MEQSKLLEQLNRFTRRKHTAQEVYMFDVILCDNEVDRDGECFTKQALETLCRRFEGVTGIFDHDPKGSRQTARIFATELVEDPARRTAYGAAYTYLKACAYMIRTDSNQDLIREIDGGIKKEVSVSCAAKTSRCSVCGSTGACAHEKGKVYGGRLCYRELEDISDVYEWSFVAVPAQVHAGVTKQYGASGGEDPVRKALQAQLNAQQQAVALARQDARKQIRQLLAATHSKSAAEAVMQSLEGMELARLYQYKDALRRDFSRQCAAQLQPGEHAPLDSFRM
ncbi:hypothetical protein [Ruminococcus champanellensis]|uniref:Uncharacterized protein n=1 Tax=Ruminococcus champanellensis (strain DSM 18848 / JCM 17042 / KCTC 15320 / 18P13) TaxID=213810 RepID=D4LA87_RUMC1|nr:hypothetical protein [Ruminococcus champanellensis]CBL16532.1 hypothetical protein RUM_02890 [Ruminococcus champanellensis 18P13 = JCM 17042]